MKDLAVFGLGRLGTSLAMTYSQKGGKVIAIDKDQDKVDEIADYVTYAIRADVTEENIVKNLGMSNVDVVAICMGDNFEGSIIVTTICKEMGVSYIIAKAKNKLQGNVLKKIGADEIIYPESEVGKRLASNLLSGGNFLDIADLSDEFSIIEVKVPKQWVGKSLLELNPRKEYGVNVIALKSGDEILINLDTDRTFSEEEEVVIIGDNNQLSKLFSK